jgi:hypothetical protein
VGFQGIAMRILVPPAKVIHDLLSLWQLADTAIEARHGPERQRELGAGAGGHDRVELAQLAIENGGCHRQQERDLVALGVAVDGAELDHQVLDGVEHQVSKAHVEWRRKVVDLLGQAGKAPAVKTSDDVDSG